MTSPRSSCRTLSIGGATFDLFLRTDNSIIHECDKLTAFALPLGSKIRVKDVISTCGGGANNTAVGLARLGCTAAFAGVIGNDQWGQILLKNMTDETVDTNFATVVEEETSSFSLILSADSGERVILYDPGTNRHLHDVTFDRDAAATMDAVFLNHIHADSCVIEDDIINILLNLPDIHLSWNPGGCQIEAGLKEKNNKLLVGHTDLLLLNKEEALAFSGKRTVLEALHVLKEAEAKIIAVTDGKNGAIATDGKTLHRCPVIPAPVVDTTGAGDAFGTGMTWALLSGLDLPTALKTGTINAMSVVGVVGAQAGLLTQTQIQEKLESTSIDVTAEPF